jgi:hypothetical protein
MDEELLELERRAGLREPSDVDPELEALEIAAGLRSPSPTFGQQDIQLGATTPFQAQALASPQAQEAQAGRAQTVGEFLIPTYGDLTTAGGLSTAGSVLASAASMHPAARIPLALGAGSATKRVLEAAPEILSQAGSAAGNIFSGVVKSGRNVLASSLEQGPSLDSLNPLAESISRAGSEVSLGRIAEEAGLSSVGQAAENVASDVALIGLGRAAESGIAAVGSKLASFRSAQKLAKDVAAKAQIRALGIDASKLKEFDLIGEDLEQSLQKAFVAAADDGAPLTSNALKIFQHAKKRQQALGAELSSELEAVSKNLYRDDILPGDNPIVAAEYLAAMLEEKAKEIKGQLVAKGKEVYLKELNNGIDWVRESLITGVKEAVKENPYHLPTLASLNSIKSAIYQGARFSQANPSQSAIWVDRQLGSILKQTIDDLAPSVVQKNKLYGDYEEIINAIQGPLGRYNRGEQLSFTGQMQGASGTAVPFLLMTQNNQNSSPINMAVNAYLGLASLKALSTTPAFRRSVANFASSLARGGMPYDAAFGYAANRLAEYSLNTSQQTPIPRDSSIPMEAAIAAPRIMRSMLEAGAPPEMAAMESMRIAAALESGSPTDKKMALRELSAIMPQALEQNPSGYRSVIDNKFNDPMEQSDYVYRVLREDQPLLDKARAVGAAVSGEYLGTGSQTPSAQTQAMPVSPYNSSPLDLDSFSSALDVIPRGMPSSTPQGDLVQQMKRLSAGTERSAY